MTIFLNNLFSHISFVDDRKIYVEDTMKYKNMITMLSLALIAAVLPLSADQGVLTGVGLKGGKIFIAPATGGPSTGIQVRDQKDKSALQKIKAAVIEQKSQQADPIVVNYTTNKNGKITSMTDMKGKKLL